MGIFKDEKENIRLGRVLLVPVLIIFFLWLVFSSFVTVQPGHRGVIVELGAVQDRVLGEGFYTITPFVQHVEMIEVRTQKYEKDAAATTVDLLDVKTTVAVNYHLSEGEVNRMFQTVGLGYEDRLIAPAVQEIVKSVTARFDAEKLVTQRESVKQKIETSLRDRLGERGIIVETISITNFEFPIQFNQAITDKQTAVQLKQKAENDLQRIEVEARQTKAKAEGEAAAIKAVNEELLKSPQYIQYLAVQKWDGVMPKATGGALPFIQIPV